jgi:hypothetical protein
MKGRAMANHADLLAPYKKVRDVRFHLSSTLVRTLSKEVLDQAGRALGMLRQGTFVFDSEDQTAVLMDYAIYNVRSGGRNAVERYIDKSPPPPSSDQSVVLQAMLKAYYSLLEVVDVEHGVGVSVRDILRGNTDFLVDVGFGSTAHKGMLMATRVIRHEGFVTTGGAALPVPPAAGARINKDLGRMFPPNTDFTHLTPKQEADLAALVIRECLAADASSHVAYAEPSQISSPRNAAPMLAARPRANRNDPCPCGSGRKYKACCGRRGGP